jgi:hypothetical protein
MPAYGGADDVHQDAAADRVGAMERMDLSRAKSGCRGWRVPHRACVVISVAVSDCYPGMSRVTDGLLIVVVELSWGGDNVSMRWL